MSITQTSTPSELTVTAHATLAEPLITISGLDVVLTPREATSLSEQLAAACAEIRQRRPDVAQSDARASQEKSYRQRLSEFVDAVAPAIEDAHAHSPYRMGVTSAMQRLRAERERLASESARPAATEVLSLRRAPGVRG